MKFSTPIYVVAARRSPIGRLGGALSTLSAVELATQVARDTLSILPDKSAVGSVIFGHVLQAGCGMNLARQVALNCELPQSTPAFTVNMVCGSGLQAIAQGAREIALGEAEIVLAGGAESMSNAPHLLVLRNGKKFGDANLLDSILSDGLTDPIHKVAMGETAELLAAKYEISREDQDAFALQSQQRAVASAGKFEREIVAIQTAKNLVSHDEHPRADTTLEKLSALRPAFRKDGTVTAGNASGLNDGAACVLLASESAVRKYNLQPLARLVGATTVGCDPLLMGIGPVGAIRQLETEIGWGASEADAIEINEAFAAQSLACARELKIDAAKLNQRGGSIALGHPIGASGARVFVTLLHLLEDENLARGIASLCIGGGMGIAAGIELVSPA